MHSLEIFLEIKFEGTIDEFSTLHHTLRVARENFPGAKIRIVANVELSPSPSPSLSNDHYRLARILRTDYGCDKIAASDAFVEEAILYLKDRKKVGAMKCVREGANIKLQEAKNAVEILIRDSDTLRTIYDSIRAQEGKI